MRSRYRLNVKGEGFYEADTLWGLCVLILGHRYGHWRCGEGWRD